MSRKKTRIAIAFTLVAGLLAWLTVSGFNENMQYYVTIRDALQMSGKVEDRGLRVKGYLVPGSVQKSQNSLDVEFVIEENGDRLTVRYDKELPDTFRDGSEVLVEGKMTSDGTFDAKMLMAKCPSKYETAASYGQGHPEAIARGQNIGN